MEGQAKVAETVSSGGGLIVGRIVNEFGIARRVTEALKESLGSAPVG